MLNPDRLGYMEAARSALGLSLKLNRISQGDGTDSDFRVVMEAAEDFTKFLKDPDAAKPTFALFAAPHGLRVTASITASRHNGDPLKYLANMLGELRKELQQRPLPKKTRNKASELSQIFRDIHDGAEEVVANIPRGALQTGLRAAIALR